MFYKGQTPWNKGKSMNDDFKKKISDLKKGIHAGDKNPMFGKPGTMLGKKFSEEHRRKISERLRGRIFSQEHREKIRKAKAQISLETRIKMSQAKKGKPTWSKGKKMSLESRLKMKEKRKHRIVPQRDSKPERMMQISLALNGIQFEKHKAITGQPDIFIEPNICVFIDGDFYHANPKKYKFDDYIIRNQKAVDIWKYDKEVTNILTLEGYIVIRLWESDVKANTNQCAEKIIKTIKQLSGEKTWQRV